MIITRCPNCHARFRVTEGQLKLAEGQVRCGACLNVFSAIAHEVSSFNPDPVTSEPPSRPEPRAKSTEQPEASHNDNPTSRSEPFTPPPQTPREVETPPDDADEPRSAAMEAAIPGPTTGPLIAEPLQLSTYEDERNPITTAFVLLGMVLAVATLLFQLLWFERARLAQQPQLQGIYSLLCLQLNCDLGTAAGLSQIRNNSLHVQPHPRFADALKVSIVLENTAPFSQPWPAIELRFTDLKGRDVAKRIFQPEEYLDTRSLSTQQMPPGQPMQIELELAAPGRRGVSYELSLLPPAHNT